MDLLLYLHMYTHKEYAKSNRQIFTNPMFIILQIKYSAYVTNTIMQLFHIVNIETKALVPSVHKFINIPLKRT